MGIQAQDAALPPHLVSQEPHESQPVFDTGMFQKLHHLLSRDEPLDADADADADAGEPGDICWPEYPPPKSKRTWPTLPVAPALTRQDTLTQQKFDRFERLSPRPSCNIPITPVSRSHRKSMSLPRRASSTPANHPARTSAPVVAISGRAEHSSESSLPVSLSAAHLQHATLTDRGIEETSRPSRSPSITSSIDSRSDYFSDTENRAHLNAELDTRWILNLSMHFRDKTDREKFFVTYAQSPNKWRRATISCYYRNAEPGSLEADLKQLHLQRDKNLMIYEAIRDSLPEIQFYDTVTNLKLETTDSRLHVHVTEDVNEIIPYPPRSAVAHLLDAADDDDDDDDEPRPRQVRESELEFQSHLSGFVYKVNYHGHTCIKKEIPGPDTVDEFLYEINALYALRDSSSVIKLQAIVLDDSMTLVKGLLISYAERGAIVDLLYDHKGSIPLDLRLRWARDAVIGLSDIHQEGYVQGDFTLSNIVVDSEGDAKIIDINRRGCPVGWEPPEIRAKIQSHQRIFMYIGEKSDLYQLGISLWGLAADDDEPERHDMPLLAEHLPDEVPSWYKQIVRICLSERPRDRWPARDLIKLFPDHLAISTRPSSRPANSELGFRRQKQYIDPAAAVEREDIDQFRNQSPVNEMLACSPQSSRDDYTFTYPRSSDYEPGSTTSAGERPRGRRPPTNLEHLTHRERRPWSTGEPPSPANPPPAEDDADVNILEIVPGRRSRYEEIEFEGRPFLIARNTFSDHDMKILEHAATSNETENVPDSSSTEPAEVNTAEADLKLTKHDSNGSSLVSGTSTLQNYSSQNHPEISNQHAAEESTEALPQSSTSHPTSENLPPLGLHSHPPSNETRCSEFPQAQRRLQYADSGFREPLFVNGEVESSEPGPLPVHNKSGTGGQNLSHTLEPSGMQVVSHATLAQSSASSFDPPLLQRSDTAFKVGCDSTSHTALS